MNLVTVGTHDRLCGVPCARLAPRRSSLASIACAGVAALLAVLLVSGPAARASANPPRRDASAKARAANLSRSPSASASPAIAVDALDVFVAWVERVETVDGPKGSVVAAASHDGGETFAAPTIVATLEGLPSGIVARASGGVLHLAWLSTQFGSGLPIGVTYSRSVDGIAFDAPRDLNLGAGAAWPALAADGLGVAVAWVSDGATTLVRSADAGASFTPPVPVASEPAIAGSVRVGVTGERVTVGWIADRGEQRAAFERSLPLAGDDASESEPRELSAPGVRVTELALDAAAGRAAVAWIVNGAPPSLLVALSTDGGQTYPVVRDLGPTASPARPSLRVAGETIYSTFVTGKDDVMLARLPYAHEGGSVELVAESGALPKLAVDGSNVAVSWEPVGLKAKKVFVRLGTVGAERLNAAASVRTGSKHPVGALLGLSAGRAHLAWLAPAAGPLDVFYASLPAA